MYGAGSSSLSAGPEGRKNQCEALRALQSPPRVDGGWAQLCREHAVLVDGLSPWVPHSIAVLHWRWAKVAMLSWCVIAVLMARGREEGGKWADGWAW